MVLREPASRAQAVVLDADGVPVFAGTTVPVQTLAAHLARGGSVEEYLTAFPALSPDLVRAALLSGLDTLTSRLPRPRQASFLPQFDSTGAILNAEELLADQIIGRAVLCPGCRAMAFRTWPEGWDSHAAFRCSALLESDPAARKAEYKARFQYLFR